MRGRLLAFARPPQLLLAGALALVGALLLGTLPVEIHQDTWLSLVAGREIARSGIPSHNTLTIVAYGHPWHDQQWLAQLCMYGLERLGGIGLVSLVSVGLVLGAVAGGAFAARRLGARLRSVGWVLPAALCGLGVGLEVRTQAYAYPLLVAVVYLLSRDSRNPWPWVWWCLPLLVLWGNLHGSAILGAGLVSLRGLAVAWERRRTLTSSPRAWAKPAGLLLGGPACLMANPYGPSIASYYHATVFNGELRKLVSEWQPVTYNTYVAVVFFLLAAAAIWSIGRHPRRSTLWERCALLVLAIGGIVAVRNVAWFALAMLVLLPVWIDPSVPRVPPVPGLRGRWAGVVAAGVAAFGAVWLLAGAVSTLTRSSASLEQAYPQSTLAAVREEVNAHPSWRVFADDAYADWLLWSLPSLRGRVATDIRFELLSAAQLRSEVDLGFRAGVDWARAARGCRLIVLNAGGSARAVSGFEHEPGARTVYDHGGAVVIVRAGAPAAA